MYYLNCTFDEKEEVKSVGGRWDPQQRKWYVPDYLWNELENFNPWTPRGRMYLNCSFGDKDRVKSLGGKWDPQCKKWYFFPSKTRTPDTFREWLPFTRNSSSTRFMSPVKERNHQTSTPSTERKKESPMKVENKAKDQKPSSDSSNNATMELLQSSFATLPRINKDLTISQLQEECKERDPSITGLSSKKKEWFLEHLGVGSVWLVALGQQQNVNTTDESIGKKRKGEEIQEDTPESTGDKAKKSKKDTGAVVPIKNAESDKDALTVAPTSTQFSRATLSSLPKVSQSMTVAQLNHELHHRDPSVKGTSNKNKQWFLGKLGIGSVWTSSSDASIYDFSSVPKISSSMKIAQLSHEVMERNPAIQGLSGKNKAWFLEQLAEGSVWVTGIDTMDGAGRNLKKSTSRKPTKKDDTSKYEKKTKIVPNAKNKASSSYILPSTKLKSNPNEIVELQSTHSTKESSDTSIIRVKKEQQKIGSTSIIDKKHANIVDLVIQPKSFDSSLLSTEPGEKSQHNEKKVLSEQLSHSIPASSQKLSASLTKVKKEQKNTVVKPALSMKASTSVPVKGELMGKSRPLSVEKKTVAKAKLSTVATSSRGVPVVTKSMTIDQLKNECKARDANVKGISNKSKAWFIQELGENSEVEGSLEWKKAIMEESRKKHTIHCLCHEHPLAKSCELRLETKLGTRFAVKRSDHALCDVEHKHICTTRSYLTCVLCDFDICQACYEIEKRPESEKRKILEEMYEAIRKEEHDKQIRLEKERQERHRIWKQQEEESDRIEKLRVKKIEDATKNAPANIKKPEGINLNEDKKLKYTVWTSCGYDNDGWHSYEGPPRKEFDSSFNTLDEANRRAHYVFLINNPWGSDLDEIEPETDTIKSEGCRFIQCCPDDSERWTVSVIPSIAFDYINDELDGSSYSYSHSMHDWDQVERKKRLSVNVPNSIKNPGSKHLNQQHRLKYTVLTNDVFKGHNDIIFDSSFDTLEEANRRAGYVFYEKNPAGKDEDLTADKDIIKEKTGARIISSCPEDSRSSWTVSVIASEAFDYISQEN